MSDIDDIMDFREMVESELAKLAAERATGENIASMEAALERMVNNASSISKLTYYDTRFHMEIANASGNTLMISTMKNVEAAFSKGMYSAFHIDTDENIQQAIPISYYDIGCNKGKRFCYGSGSDEAAYTQCRA